MLNLNLQFFVCTDDIDALGTLIQKIVLQDTKAADSK